MFAQPFEKNTYNALICPGLSPEPPLGPARPGFAPTSQAVLVNASAMVQQVVPSFFPNVPIAGVVLVSTVVPPIINPGVDPPVIVGPVVFDILLEIVIDQAGNTNLSWNNITGIHSIGLNAINDILLERSDDNINYLPMVHWVSTGNFTNADTEPWIQLSPFDDTPIPMPSSFSDNHAPVLNYFFRLTEKNSDNTVVAVYNVVSRTTSYTLSGVAVGSQIQLNWNAPVLT